MVQKTVDLNLLDNWLVCGSDGQHPPTLGSLKLFSHKSMKHRRDGS